MTTTPIHARGKPGRFRALAVLFLVAPFAVLLDGCGKGEERKLEGVGDFLKESARQGGGKGPGLQGDGTVISRPPELPPVERCRKCGEPAGARHVCGVTRYCSICRRDIGEEHICFFTSMCPKCYVEGGNNHECGVTHFCTVCRRDVGPNHLSERSTRKCYTLYCSVCKADVGRDHVCGVTYFCPRCRAEVAENHVCDLTRYCPSCKRDVAVSAFCPACSSCLGRTGTEIPAAGPRCAACKEAVTLKAFRLGETFTCEKCGITGHPELRCKVCDETVTPIVHVCGRTFFCPKCRIEAVQDTHRH
ncbi:MAG: hypothetical protein RDV41_09870 [Planctomycetota bacterium]|nr:hypothetical protein [Planctomycetota bacterium]